jgi:hypothetical protein
VRSQETYVGLAQAEASVEAHSASLKKVLGVRDLALTQILFIVGLAWIGVAAKLRSAARRLLAAGAGAVLSAVGRGRDLSQSPHAARGRALDVHGT